jgi:hypothetical protein
LTSLTKINAECCTCPTSKISSLLLKAKVSSERKFGRDYSMKSFQTTQMMRLSMTVMTMAAKRLKEQSPVTSSRR